MDGHGAAAPTLLKPPAFGHVHTKHSGAAPCIHFHLLVVVPLLLLMLLMLLVVVVMLLLMLVMLVVLLMLLRSLALVVLHAP